MPSVNEVYDDEEVQRSARSQLSRLTGVTSAAVALTLLGITAIAAETLPLPLVVVSLIVLWLGVALWTLWHLRRLRRRVWCVRLTDEGIEGYDYARRKLTLAWDHVRRIDVTDDGLTVIGGGPAHFEVPNAFHDYPGLSHRLVHHAEGHHIPLYVDGRPWQQLDVYHLFPMLTDEPFSNRSGSAV